MSMIDFAAPLFLHVFFSVFTIVLWSPDSDLAAQTAFIIEFRILLLMDIKRDTFFNKFFCSLALFDRLWVIIATHTGPALLAREFTRLENWWIGAEESARALRYILNKFSSD